jgi:predicted esterase
MDTEQKRVFYNASNTYITLNTCTANTKYVWMVFHGIGYLSKYFLPYFNELNPAENFIIAPQAPSKYYLDKSYRHIGASWLTREDTAMETENILRFINAVYEDASPPEHCRLVVFGYSQGVSVAMRWVAKSKIKCERLALYAGGIPDELSSKDFLFLRGHTRVTFMVGDSDEFLSPERMERESGKIEALFDGQALIQVFNGGHAIQKPLINQIIQ